MQEAAGRANSAAEEKSRVEHEAKQVFTTDGSEDEGTEKDGENGVRVQRLMGGI